MKDDASVKPSGDSVGDKTPKAKQFISVDDLIELAHQAAGDAVIDNDDDSGYGTRSNIAREFVLLVSARILGKYGEEADGEFCRAIGFDHLLEKNSLVKASTAEVAETTPAADVTGGTATGGGDPVDVLWCDSCGRPDHLHVRTETAGLLCPYPFSGSFRPLSVERVMHHGEEVPAAICSYPPCSGRYHQHSLANKYCSSACYQMAEGGAS